MKFGKWFAVACPLVIGIFGVIYIAENIWGSERSIDTFFMAVLFTYGSVKAIQYWMDEVE